MPDLETFVAAQLAEITTKHRYRQLALSERNNQGYILHNGKELLSFSCNDYLGLSHHPQVKQAAMDAVARYGAGAGASRFVTGNHPYYLALEQKLAAYKGTESACVVGSGYLANSGVIPAFIEKGDLILADKLSHACLLDGARLSGATLLRFPHNNLEQCEALLKKHRASARHCLIVTETVFSMDGDRAPLAALSALAKSYDAWLLADDAHGLGVVDNEAGVDIQTGTLSKALGGYGGYICGTSNMIDYIQNTARSLIFSTALPPRVVAAASAALDILMRDDSLTATVIENARLFTSLLGLEPAASAIVPFIIGTSEDALAASTMLEAEGFLVKAIRPPTVPPGTARLRITFSAHHKKEDIERLAAAIRKLPVHIRQQ